MQFTAPPSPVAQPPIRSSDGRSRNRCPSSPEIACRTLDTKHPSETYLTASDTASTSTNFRLAARPYISGRQSHHAAAICRFHAAELLGGPETCASAAENRHQSGSTGLQFVRGRAPMFTNGHVRTEQKCRQPLVPWGLNSFRKSNSGKQGAAETRIIMNSDFPRTATSNLNISHERPVIHGYTHAES